MNTCPQTVNEGIAKAGNPRQLQNVNQPVELVLGDDRRSIAEGIRAEIQNSRYCNFLYFVFPLRHLVCNIYVYTRYVQSPQKIFLLTS